MTVKIKAATRKHLGSQESIERIQGILCDLSADYLPPTLVEEMGEDDDEKPYELNLSKKGDLAECIKKELTRSTESGKRWRALMKDMLPEKIPYERQLGSVHFESPDRSKEVHLSFDEYELARNVNKLYFGNSLSITSEEGEYRGKELAEVTLSAMKRVFDNDIFDHGFCCVDDQYDAKNLDRSGGGLRAVGIDVSKHLPGFYWGNYFGEYFCELIGLDVLLDTPGCRSYKLQSGVIVTNSVPPDSWSDVAFIENETLAIDHIGKHLFFEKGKTKYGTLFSRTEHS